MRTLSTVRISITTGVLVLAGTLATVSTAGNGQPVLDASGTRNAGELEQGKAGTHGGGDVYGIINLASPPVFRAFINARGQAAFEFTGLDNNPHVGFFNGERVFKIDPRNSPGATVGGLNDRGDVALQAPFFTPGPPPTGTPLRPFRWSAASGAVPLPILAPEADTFTNAINNRGEVVGASSTAPGEGNFQAVRWTATSRLLRLPSPAGFGEAFAFDINDSNVSVGLAEDPTGTPHVVRWDAAGRPTNLGTFGAASAFALYNNNRGDIAGMVDFFGPDFAAFLWSPGRGVAFAGPNTVVSRMNGVGELAGRRGAPNGALQAFVFSRARGLVDLHPARLYASEANDLNDSGVVVGLAQRSADGESRAYRWSRTGTAVDLNTRLLNPPSGLVLTSALGVAANGDIVASSNAGLVYLRLGGGGTDAPVLGPIRLAQPRVNELAELTLSFRDRNLRDTHKATVDWGDGSGTRRAAVREQNGRGEVRATHRFTNEGNYAVVVRVTDSTGKTTMLNQWVNVPRPDAPADIPGSSNAPSFQLSAPGWPSIFRLLEEARRPGSPASGSTR